ncbi:MAG: polymorphic toxin type 44 domain-containing protein [Bacteroidia bacterium]
MIAFSLEIYGTGNAVSYKYRVEDPRLGRFLSVDPLSAEYPWNSPYAFSENRVIDGIELEGLEYYYTAKGYLLGNWGTSQVIKIVPEAEIARAKDAFLECGDFCLEENTYYFEDYLPDVSETLLYEVGSQVTDPKIKKGITGQSLRDGHPLKYNEATGEGGTFAGTPVLQSDLFDITEEFNHVLKDNLSHFEQGFWSKNIRGGPSDWWFGLQVTDDANYDIKSLKRTNLDLIPSYAAISIGEWTLYEGRLTRYDDYGNISYGYWGTHYGFNRDKLLSGADDNQDTKNGKTTTGVGDEQRDKDAINLGIDKYLNRD